MLAFLCSPASARPLSHRIISTCRAKRSGAKRPPSGGGGFGKPKPKPTKNKRTHASDTRDFNPRPPKFTEQPDPETLRAEFEKRGIDVPKDYKFGTADKTDDDDDGYTTSSDGTMPEVVAARMGRRIALFGGIPFTLLFGFFATYFVLTYKFEIRVIPAVVAYSTLVLIGVAGVGITYGIFSSSWDPEEEGSALGVDEAKVNFFRARDALMGQRRQEKQDEEFDRIDRIVEEKKKKKNE